MQLQKCSIALYIALSKRYDCRSESLADTAIPVMTSLQDGDFQHSSAFAQSPKEL